MEQHRTLIPDYLLSTYQMLECAFPAGIMPDDYIPLLMLLNEQMGHRNIAEVLSVFLSKDYAEVLNDLYRAISSNPPTAAALIGIKARLEPCNYDSWLAEDR
jgi:hypothetical protein